MLKFDSFAPPPIPKSPRHQQGWRHFWTFFIPAFSGWFAAVFLFLLFGSGLEGVNAQTALGTVPMALLLLPVSLLATPITLLCLAACIAFSASMRTPNLRRLKPLFSAGLGLIVFQALEFTFRGFTGVDGFENLRSWPVWAAQVLPAAITTASAWAASSKFFPTLPTKQDKESQERAARPQLSNYPRPPRRRRPPMRQAMKVFLSCFLPAFSGWVAVLTLFLILSIPTTGSRWTDLLWLPLWLPVFLTISLTLPGVWIFLAVCAAFGLSMISPLMRQYRAALSAVLGVLVYFVVEAENLEGIFRGLSGRLPESSPLFTLQITAALVTGGVAWLTTAKLFPSKAAPAGKSLDEALPLSTEAPKMEDEADHESVRH